MKRRLLMPLIVAGLMITMALSFSSCKKTENKTDIDSIPTVETPIYGDRVDPVPYMTCPYCNRHIPAGTYEHIHYFAPEGTIPSSPEPPMNWIYPVNHCNEGFTPDASGNIQVCPYSGELQDMFPGNPMFLPRFHRHNLVYILFGPDGGQANHWHVGGGTTE